MLERVYTKPGIFSPVNPDVILELVNEAQSSFSVREKSHKLYWDSCI